MRAALRGILITIAVTLCAASAFAVWRLGWVPSHAMHLVGMEGPWLWSGRECSLPHDQPWFACAQYMSDPRRQLLDDGVVSVNRYTGALNVAARHWTVSDSLRWATTVDSIRRAMRSSGGRTFSCDGLDRTREIIAESQQQHPDSAPVMLNDAWHFRVADVHMMASGPPVFLRERPPQPWTIEVIAYGGGLPECQPVRYTVRLLTPAEWLAREREALAQELGF